MKPWMMAAALAASLGAAGTALAQTNLVVQRKEGMREMGRHLEAIQGIMQTGGSQAAIAERADRIIAFYGNLDALYPSPTLTPPLPEGRAEGQTRALAAIQPNRAAFDRLADSMVAQLTSMKTAAANGGATPDMLRAAGQICANCHNQFRAR
ncbi:cytochrome c [Falsiroseomonas sp. HW251]|uniref:cytochrome c n=1 Tax=Falsiroseomonas sp. HW251 TaxID=3390998 RepID=UPI003D3128FF